MTENKQNKDKTPQTAQSSQTTRPTNRGKLRRGLTLLVAVVVALGVAYGVLTKTRLVPWQVSKYINQHVMDDTRFEFACGSITGDLVNHVVLHEPVIRYHGADASYNVFRADEIVLDYSLSGVLRLNLDIQDLQFRNVRLQIRQDREGRIVLPVPVKSDFVQEDDVFAPRVDVRQYAVEGLHLYFGGEEHELAVENVNLSGSYHLERGTGRLLVNRGSAYIPGSQTPVQSIELEVFHEQKSVRIQDFSVRLGSSFIMANGRFEDGRFDRMQFIFNPVVLGELHELGLIPSLDGEMGGNVIVNGAPGSLKLDGTVTGSGFGYVMNSVEFSAEIGSDEITFDRLAGEVFGARMDGTFRYSWSRNGSFVYSGAFNRLDLANGFLPEVDFPPMDLNGTGSLQYDGRDSYTISAELDSARIERYEAGSGNFEAVWVEDVGLDIEAFQFDRPGYSVIGSGTVTQTGTTDLLFTAEGTNLSHFWDYAAIPPISGGVSVGGIVAGEFGDLRINLNGTVENTGFLFAVVDSATVQAEVSGVTGDNVSARVDLSGNNLYLQGQRFLLPHLRLDAGDGQSYVSDFSFSRGDSFATMDFKVSATETGSIVEFKHISLDFPGQNWQMRRPVTLDVSEGAMNLDSLVFESGDKQLGIAGMYSESDGSIDIEGWAHRFDLMLLHEGLGLPVQFRGTGDFRFSVNGSMENPDVSLTADIRDGVVDSVYFDTLRLDSAYDGDRWNLHELRLVSDGDSLSVFGWWDFGVSPFALAAGNRNVREGRDRPVRMDVTSVHYPVPDIMRAVRAPAKIDGTFTGSFVVENYFDDPVIRLEGFVEPNGRFEDEMTVTAGAFTGPVVNGRVGLPPTFVRASLIEKSVIIEEIFVGGGINATISGSLPVGLSLIEGLKPRSSDSMNVEIDLESTDINSVAAYSSHLSSLAGSTRGKIEITGTPENPSFGGSLLLEDGAVRFVVLDEVYTDIFATLQFDENTIDLTSIRGKSRGENAFTGSGTVLFDGFSPYDYQLDMAFTDFWIKRQPDFEGLVDGNLNVTAFEDAERSIPDITGKLTVKQAEIVYLFEAAGPSRTSSLTRPTASPGWLCSIDLDVHKNLWARNPDMNVELGGRLILKRDHTGLYLRGDLSALRGWYTVYNNKFEVIDGTLNFSAAEGFRPEIFINAYTPYRVEDGQESNIYLTLTWPRDKIEPELKLSSDQPGYYESDLWRMLGGEDIAGGLAANTLEKLLNQQMSGMTVYVDRRSVGRTSTGTAEHEMMIGVGKYLFEDLYLSYRQGLTLTADQAVEVEYRLRNMIYIRSGIIRHSNPRYAGSILRSTDEYNLDVKFRWEY